MSYALPAPDPDTNAQSAGSPPPQSEEPIRPEVIIEGAGQRKSFRRKLTENEKATFLANLEGGFGRNTAMRQMGIDHRVLTREMTEDAEFGSQIVMIEKSRIEMAETVIYRRVLEEDMGAAALYLRHQQSAQQLRMANAESRWRRKMIAGQRDNAINFSNVPDDQLELLIRLDNGENMTDEETLRAIQIRRALTEKSRQEGS